MNNNNNNNNNSLEFLDLLAIVSFAMQMEVMDQMQREATNNDIIENLHHDLEVVDTKLNKIMEHLGIS